MQHNDDPRNIFFNQRMEYRKETQSRKKQRNREYNTTEKNNATKQNNFQRLRRKGSGNEKLAEKYQREGEGQLVKDIVNSVIEQKAAGKLSNEQLVAFAKGFRRCSMPSRNSVRMVCWNNFCSCRSRHLQRQFASFKQFLQETAHCQRTGIFFDARLQYLI